MALQVERLLSACPFLLAHLDADDFALATVVFGAVATHLKARTLLPTEEDRVFGHFNLIAERGDSEQLDVLGTGAIELFNDDPASQRLARSKLAGPALQMLEDFQVSWGQPDYGAG